VAFAVSFGVLTLVRDRIPRIALVLAALAVCAHYTVGLPSIGVILPLLVILTAVTLAGHRTFALVTAGVLFAVASFFRIRGGETAEVVLGYELLSNLVLAALAVALAEVIRTRRALVASQAEAARMAVDAARAEARRAQEEDRTRIARQLHDDLGHSLAIVSLHANAVAEAVPDEDPAHVSAHHLRDAASQALGQLCRAVRAVGSPVDPPALEGLETLLDRIRAGGVSVDVVREHGPLPAAVDALAFRIVQEATTNALRHAAPAHIGLALTTVPSSRPELQIRVLNDGVDDTAPGSTTGPGGSSGPSSSTGTPGSTGLTSLHDRVTEVGGTLSWGVQPPDLFVVEALLPVGDEGTGA
jgi:signal transduction histidine kinase